MVNKTWVVRSNMSHSIVKPDCDHILSPLDMPQSIVFYCWLHLELSSCKSFIYDLSFSELFYFRFSYFMIVYNAVMKGWNRWAFTITLVYDKSNKNNKTDKTSIERNISMQRKENEKSQKSVVAYKLIQVAWLTDGTWIIWGCYHSICLCNIKNYWIFNKIWFAFQRPPLPRPRLSRL